MDPIQTTSRGNQRHTGNAPNQEVGKARFFTSLPAGFTVPKPSDEVGMRLLANYGAVLVARGGATPPPVLVFPDEDSVARWQASVKTGRAAIGRTVVELQNPALRALMEARLEAQSAKLDITPRGTDAARRSYRDTVVLWSGRVRSGLEHWTKAGRLDQRESQRIFSLPLPDQVREVLGLEKQGLFFSKDFSKSILASVAPPGASQHISMLALDINEFADPEVRSILGRHGWFQTVLSDLPHFTFLGTPETELSSLGLRKVTFVGRPFWIPDLGTNTAGRKTQP